MNLEKINILDLFSGTGGFSHGFTSYSKKFNVVGAVELDTAAAQTTKMNHPDCLVINKDIRETKPSVFKEHLNGQPIDLIIGGPPCQGFSSIRPFRSSSEEDPRNTLFEQFALYVNFFKPKYFVMENVVGLVTHNNGITLQIIEEVFLNLGYDCEWKILNAANYGVPQKRERFIMIGTLNGGTLSFPEPTHSFNGKTIGIKDKSKMVVEQGKLDKAVSVMEAISDLPPLNSGESIENYISPPLNEYQLERRKNTKDILNLHQATNHPPKMLEIIKYAGDNISCIPSHLITSGFSNCYSRLSPDEPGPTITVKFVNPASSKCIHPYQDRALTPREGARIQSFDDDYKFAGSRVQIIKQIGNAVPPLLGKAIAKSIVKSFTEIKGE